MKKIMIVIILITVICTASCNKPKGTYLTWEWGLEQYEIPRIRGLLGYIGKNKKQTRDNLFNFLTVNKKLYFKDENEYIEKQALFEMLGGDFITGLKRWRSYVKETGDIITPSLEMAELTSCDFYLGLWSSINRDIETEIIKNGIILNDYQSSFILYNDDGYSQCRPYIYLDQLSVSKEFKEL